jgi:outer membrane protein assembly factor BamB
MLYMFPLKRATVLLVAAALLTAGAAAALGAAPVPGAHAQPRVAPPVEPGKPPPPPPTPTPTPPPTPKPKPKPTPHFDWTTWGFDSARTGYNPHEVVLSPKAARSLRQKWTFNAGAVINTQPMVAAGVTVTIHHERTTADLVFVGTEHGGFFAINATNGRLVWSRQGPGGHGSLGYRLSACADIPDHHFGISSAPLVDRVSNTIFVAGGDGKLYALDMSTGSTRRGWPVRITGDPSHEHVWSSLTRSTDGAIYVSVGSDCDIVPYRGRVAKVRIASHQVVASWSPVPRFASGGAIWGWGGVSVDRRGHVFTGTGNVFGPSEHAYYAEHVVRLTKNLRVQSSNFVTQIKADDDIASAPTLYQAPRCPPQLAVMQKHGWLYIYNRNALGFGPMQIIRMDSAHDFIGGPAWDPVTHMVYVSHAHDSFGGHFVNGIAALRVGRHCRLGLAWQRRSPHTGVPSAPIVAGGVVYYGNGIGRRLLAYNAATGKPVWNSGTTVKGGIFAAPTVVNGSLYVASWDRRLHAFSVPGRSDASPGT